MCCALLCGKVVAHDPAPIGFSGRIAGSGCDCRARAGGRAYLGGADMMALRIARLRARFGLTAAQAANVAALAWGGGQ